MSKWTLTYGGIELPVESFGIKWDAPPCATAKVESAVEFDCRFEWNDGCRVRLELDHTVNFNECDKQAIANPWYGGWH